MSSPRTAPSPLPPWPWWTAAGLGAVLLGLAGSGVVPMRLLAEATSGDGMLSEALSSLLLASQVTLGALLALVPLAMWFSRKAWERGMERLEQQPDRRVAAALGVLTAVAALMIQGALFGHEPHITDAISQTFQARIFAAGACWAPAPPCPAAFAQYNLIISPDGKWHTKYTPGHALLLALGARWEAEWMVLPLAWGLTVALFFLSVTRFRPRGESLLAAACLAGSPLGLLASASFMSHTTFLFFCVAAFALGTARMADARRPTGALLAAGCLAGLAALTRPQDVPAAALFIVALLAVTPAPLRGRALRRLPLVLVGALPAAAALLVWNHSTYGVALASGYNFGQLASHSPVIRDSIGFSEHYPVRQAVRQAAWTLLRFNKVLWGWPSSLLLLPLAWWPRAHRRSNLALLVPVLATIGLYATFPYYGLELEARYYTFALPFLALLTARAVCALADRTPAPQRRVRPAVWLAVCSLHALLFYWPRQLWPAYAGAYEFMQPGLDDAVRSAGLRQAVVLIGSGDPNDLTYSSGFVHNTPHLDGEVVYARDIPEQRAALQAAFPHRPLYRARWDGGAFQLMPLQDPP